jgi:uncharacterized membrane protein
VPGATATFVTGIASNGNLVGYYEYAGGTHGFFFHGGIYTTIDYPGAYYTLLYGVNALGQIVGQTYPADIGFLFDSATQKFTTISYPQATQTFPKAINNAGVIVGYGIGDRLPFGFEMIGSTYILIRSPLGKPNYVYGISGSGKLAGQALTTGQVVSNFLFKDGKYTSLTIPNAPGAAVCGINPLGTAVVGQYEPRPGVTFGFLYQNQMLQTLRVGESDATYAYGVDNAGEVAGTFRGTPDGVWHGFLWTPPADMAKK